MIKTTKLEIKTTNKNIKYYRSLGFDVLSGDVILINVEQLPQTSKQKIIAICDNCNEENQISYFSYLRNIKDENKYFCKKCLNIRFKETVIEKYGVEHPLKLDEIKNKIVETNLEKYGVKYTLLNEEIKNKSKDTCLLKYDTEYYMASEDFKNKTKETLLEKYDTDHPLHNKFIKNKLENTNIEKYGSKSPLGSESIRNKILETKRIKYDDENYNNREKYKKTCLINYGFDNPMKNEAIRQKLINIMFEKYGVGYPAQNSDIFNKMMKSGSKIIEYKESGIFYQGNYEFDFLERYYKHNFISKHSKIEYDYNDEKYSYYPDFYIEKLNLIVEIKSSYWYNYFLHKNIAKEKACKEQGYNFIFIIDKNYNLFESLIKNIIYDKDHSWQYDIRLKTLNDDIKYLNFDYTTLKVSDFNFEFMSKKDKRTKDIVNFIKKYEWLGTMPNRPTHRFVATYNGILAGVIIMSTPNSFSKILGEDTKNIEKLISRGACASWTPKNLASSLLMWSINWMVENTEFRLFTAYADPVAKELGTIYQACNFYYLGDNFGSDKLYFDPNRKESGWGNNRRFRKLNFYKSYLKKSGISWNTEWNVKTTILWDKIPQSIVSKLKQYSLDCLNRCFVIKTPPKHKYLYILGKNKTETKILRRNFMSKFKIKQYPKNR